MVDVIVRIHDVLNYLWLAKWKQKKVITGRYVLRAVPGLE